MAARGMRGALLTTTAVVLGYCGLLVLAVPVDGVWCGDQGAKLVLIQSLLRGSLALPYPASDVDPAATLSPLPQLFATPLAGQSYSTYSYPYAALSAPFIGLFGAGGAFVVPIASTAVMLVLAAGLARRLGAPATPIPLLVGAATPVLFYALVLWEHALTSALLVGAVALLSWARPWPAVVAGVLCGLAIWFREEAVLFGVALGAALLVAERGAGRHPLALGARFVAGFAAGAIPLLVLNRALFGDWLGVHASVTFATTLARSASDRAERQLVTAIRLLVGDAPDPVLWWAAALCVALVSALLRRPVQRERVFGVAVALVLAALLAPADGLPRKGMVGSAVWLLGACLLRPRATADPRAATLLLCTAAGFLTLGAVTAPNDGGMAWGPRYLLPAVPLLAVAGWVAVAGRAGGARGLRALPVLGLGVLVVLSLQAQRSSLWLLRDATSQSSALNQMVQSRPGRFVASDSWRAVQLLGPSYFERSLLYVGNADGVRALGAVVARSGAVQFVTPRIDAPLRGQLAAAGIACANPASGTWHDLRLFVCERAP